MPTIKSRIQIMLDDETNGLLATLADEQRQSISTTAANLIREALELHEDKTLSQVSQQRIDADTGKRYSHEDA